MENRASGALAALLLMLVGCTSGEPARMSPTVSVQEFKVPVSPATVYDRIYGRMDQCHAVHNIFFPGDIVGGMKPDGTRGRIYFARDGVALWGADIEPAEGGSKVTTRVGKDAASDRYHSLIRIWTEARRLPEPGETDC